MTGVDFIVVIRAAGEHQSQSDAERLALVTTIVLIACSLRHLIKMSSG